LAWLVKAGTMKRKLKWMSLVLVVLVVGFGTALFLLPRDRITADSWEKIRLGMTEKEVEGILGGPGISWGEYLSNMVALNKKGKLPINDGIEFLEPESWNEGIDDISVWIGQRGEIRIGMNRRGHVIAKRFQRLRPADPTFVDRIRDWLGL
jgi:hypothetical protein